MSVFVDAVGAMLTASRRRLSLVDCTSFEAMRHKKITKAFAFDQHFVEQGFEIVSSVVPPDEEPP